MNGQEYLDLLKTRYSVRSFSDVQLTDAELDVLLQAAQLSPTAKNSQPFRLCVVQSAEGLAGHSQHDVDHADEADRRQHRQLEVRYQRVSEGARL